MLKDEGCVAGRSSQRIVGLGDPRRGLQLGHPGVGRRPGDVCIDQQPWAAGIEAGMAIGHGQRGQRSGQQHGIGRVRTQPTQALRERVVERAQMALGLQIGEQAHGMASAAARANRAHSAWVKPGARP